ncbi:hypothetical protein DENIS_0495 [Desulfonema ishimotonii]|uniref:Thioredoxin-like fold domain-containing protein n=1 Tax=Desulfonema ishimotonii TaxID=45657 RepID=A0A401FRH0_9BACT|nr:thioredoxin family protein [Desulfonema ishimotonii]GBC59556.1 hypothetical protein DENIS_0495 [Desulfonema ishimotonii]
MTPQEEKQIARWNDGLPHDIRVRLVMTGAPADSEFEKFCDQFSGLAPRVRILKKKDDAEDALPAIGIGNGLRYHAIPLGRELPPFLDALAQPSPLPPALRDRLGNLPFPVNLRLYIAPLCPFCPATVAQLIPLTTAGDQISLSIIDAERFPDAARADKIQAVPTLVMDERVRWSGTVALQAVADVLAGTDPSRLSVASLEQLVKSGAAGKLAEMMIRYGDIFPAFWDLLVHEKWPVRLGAMVAAEALADQDKPLAARLIAPLWERFDAADDTLRGDLLYVMGVAGDAALIPRLEAIATGAYGPDVTEAAREAIDNIRN